MISLTPPQSPGTHSIINSIRHQIWQEQQTEKLCKMDDLYEKAIVYSTELEWEIKDQDNPMLRAEREKILDAILELYLIREHKILTRLVLDPHPEHEQPLLLPKELELYLNVVCDANHTRSDILEGLR